jgi:hypothetical protein
MADNADDKKVKQLIDEATRADLERWFGLPSFEQLAEKPVPPAALDDPEIVEARKRRDAALAHIDPALVEAHRRRTDLPPDMPRFQPSIEVCIDPDIGMVDLSMIDRLYTIAEPRERERSMELRDGLQEVAPQALLRDLHRPELSFEKVFEIVDVLAEQRLETVSAVADAMRTRWTLPPFGPTPVQEARALIRESRDERRHPWKDIKTPNRRVR